MFIHFLIWTFQYYLLIPEAYSFKTPKHDSLFYYKTHESVFLTNPTNHSTSYGIYVAGKTTAVDIPSDIANVYDIVNWKVVNLDENRLMFVHKNKPYILINQKIVRPMEYSGELSDSIIAFGDNEALHVPTIFNPNLTGPVPKWNYIELLYFDDEDESISVIQSLPWLEDDWKFIKEWKMMDYIHFDDKLYLLIKRSIWNENTANVTQEISIIRLCLDKGRELISSAVEIHFTRKSNNSNKIIELFFVFHFKPLYSSGLRYQVHTITSQPSNNTKAYHIYYIGNFVSLFEETENECASGSDKITLLRHHLRSEVGKCIKTSYKNCSTKENIVPSRNVIVIEAFAKNLYEQYNSNAPHKIDYVTLPNPYDSARIFIYVKPLIKSVICEYYIKYADSPRCIFFYTNSISSSVISEFDDADFHTNKRPHGSLFVTKETNKILFIPIKVCSNLITCTDCIMYGLYFDCIWSNSICVHDDQPKNKATLTVNNCFKIINISPLIFDSSAPTILTIELDTPLITASQEFLVIRAGDNRCTNNTMNEVFINCSMDLTESGEFNIDVSLRSDRYADTSIISAVSNDKVHIFASDSDYSLIIILILFLYLIITSSALIFCYIRKSNKKHLNIDRSKKVSRPRKVRRFVGTYSDAKFIKFFHSKKKSKFIRKSRVSLPIVSSTMSKLDDSAITNEPSSEKDSLRRTMPSATRQMYPQKKLHSYKSK